ncbi:hypothetical protein [Joostella sp.]|uniref:hypothetical protein n=1 Tax=Joostella sp. TaxID=2231138 RepID=UPI003A936EC5
MKNLITNKFTPKEEQAITKNIKDIERLISGKVTALNESERKKYGSINEINKLFVNKTHAIHAENPELSAPEVDWNEYKKDYQTRVFLEKQIQSLKSIVYQLESTKTLHDFDNYQDSLIDYSYSQYKKNAKVSGYSKKVDELKQFFIKSKNEIEK